MSEMFFEPSGRRLLMSLLIVVLTGTLMGCVGLAQDSNAREVDWRKVNAIEASAQRYGAQIIWITLPEKTSRPHRLAREVKQGNFRLRMAARLGRSRQ